VKNDENDIYDKSYGICKKTYMNKLFFLLDDYSKYGIGISPVVMSVLVNKKIGRMGINWVLYYILKILALPFGPVNFIRKGFREIQRGNASKIVQYFRAKLKL
jgi:hypothetical protein